MIFRQVPLVVPFPNRYTRGDISEGEVMSPRKAKEIVQAKIRIAADLQSQLEAAAKKHKISYNAEAAERLAKSLAEEAMVGGEEARRRLHSITNAFMFAGTNAAGGRKLSSWINEPKAYSAAMFSVIEALMIGQPEVTLEKCHLQIESRRGRIATHFSNKTKG